MPLPAPSADEFVPGPKVLKRYGITDMTLHRWQANPKLDFPKPIRINNRRYWRLADLQAFELRQSSKREAA